MSFETLLYQVDDGVCTLTLNRPEKLNAVTATSLEELIGAFDEADRDDRVRAVIVTGAGRAFCAGADLSGGGGTFSREGVTAETHRDGGGRVTLRLFDLKKPIIAAINGPAVGFGITDVNPRVGAGTQMSAALGFDPGAAAIAAAMGLSPERYLERPYGEHIVVRTYEEWAM